MEAPGANASRAAGHSRFPAKQRVGLGAMGRHLVPMAFDPCDFRPKQFDPLVQFVLGIRAEVLPRQPAGGIASGTGVVVFVHCCASSQAGALAVNGGAR